MKNCSNQVTIGQNKSKEKGGEKNQGKKIRKENKLMKKITENTCV